MDVDFRDRVLLVWGQVNLWSGLGYGFFGPYTFGSSELRVRDVDFP